ncbi:MAG: hypothetical protein B7X43_03885, partial [Thiomonas sp. 15-63-373]
MSVRCVPGRFNPSHEKTQGRPKFSHPLGGLTHSGRSGDTLSRFITGDFHASYPSRFRHPLAGRATAGPAGARPCATGATGRHRLAGQSACPAIQGNHFPALAARRQQ